jgi:hypothetical protein
MPKPAVPPPTAAALAFLLLAAALRVPFAGRELWLDDLTTSWVISDGLAEIPARSRLNNLSPFPYAINWAVVQALGASEWTLRLPSLLAGVALVPVGGWIVFRTTRNAAAAGLTAALLALDPQLWRFSLDVRPYAWVALLGLFQAWLFFSNLVLDTLPRRLAWMAATAGLVWLHYTTLVFLAAEAALFFSWRPLTGRRRVYPLTNFLADASGVAALCLPLVPHLVFLHQERKLLGSFMPRPGWASLWQVAAMFGLGGVLLFPWALSRLADRAVSQSCGTAPVELRRRITACVGALGAWMLFVPVLAAWGAAAADAVRLFLPRYLAASAAFPSVLAGLLLAQTKRPLSAWLIAGSALVFQIALFAATASAPATWAGRGWKPALQKVASEARADAGPVVLVVHSGLVESDWLSGASSELLREYCCSPVLSLYRLDTVADAAADERKLEASVLPAIVAGDRLAPADCALIRRTDPIWILSGRRDELPSLEATATVCMGRQGERTERTRWVFGSVTVVRIRRAAR